MRAKRLWTLVWPCIFISVSPSISVFAAIESKVESKNFIDEQRKLKLSSARTGWEFFGPTDYVAQGTLMMAQPIDGKLHGASLTLRADASSETTLKKYLERWLKDYPKFGYELQLSREAKHGNLDGYEIELRSSRTDKKIRQFLVKNDQEFLIFTCSAKIDDFLNAWKSCEKILSSAK